jgi:hypothetical protein
MESLGFKLREEATLRSLTEEVVKIISSRYEEIIPPKLLTQAKLCGRVGRGYLCEAKSGKRR